MSSEIISIVNKDPTHVISGGTIVNTTVTSSITTISALQDVTIASPLDTQVLAFDVTAGKWLNVDNPAISDHLSLSNIGIYSHAVVDTHIDNLSLHFEQSEITIVKSQVTDFSDAAYATAAQGALADSALQSIVPFSIQQLSDVLTVQTPIEDDVLTFDVINGWQAQAATPTPLTTKGDIYGFNTQNVRIPVGADTYVLTADSNSPNGVVWAVSSGGGGGGGDFSIDGGLAGSIYTAQQLIDGGPA